MRLPYMKRPCSNCPFRKYTLKGWLGKSRIEEIIKAESFTCHKTNKKMQCAGHMIMMKEDNEFYRLMKAMNLSIELKGEDEIMTPEQTIKRHDRRR